MLLIIKNLVSFTLSYLIGSIPTAYIFGRVMKGIDIREHGSGNVGATNAIRVLGKGPGITVLVLDILKGVVATAVLARLFGLTYIGSLVLLGLIAVLGHSWTIFLQFQGGKGVATSLGVLIGLMIQIPDLRLAVGLTFLVWAVVFLLSGYVSLASIVAAVSLPIIMAILLQPVELVLLGVILGILIVVRHRANIRRLLNHQENRVKLPFHRTS